MGHLPVSTNGWLALAIAAGALLTACHRPAPVVIVMPPSAGVAATTSDVPSRDKLMAQGDAAWLRRDDPLAAREAVSAWERAYVMAPVDPTLGTKLAEAYFVLGHYVQGPAHEDAQMRESFARGAALAEQALRSLSPGFAARLAAGDAVDEAVPALGIEACAPLAAYVGNLGALAVAKGRTTALFYGERLRTCIERLLQLDESFGQGLPHRMMGIWLAQMPGFAGGSMAGAKGHFERALALAPTSGGNLYAYAKFFARPKRDWALLQSLVARITALPTDAQTPAAVENRMTLRDAQALQPAAAKKAAL